MDACRTGAWTVRNPGFVAWARMVVVTALAVCGLACEDRGTGAVDSAAPNGRQTASAPRENKPINLILITMDTTRADALGSYGQKRRTSPSFDRLAESGVLFEQASTTNPETFPSHSSILTSRWPFAHGVRANSGYVLSDRNLTLAEHLASHGYRTGVEIAAPVLRKETQITQGFEHYRGPESKGVVLKTIRQGKSGKKTVKREMRVGSNISSAGIEFIRKHRDRKFFLWLHYFDAHSPYSAPRMFNNRVPDSSYHAEVANQDHQIGLLIKEIERLGLRRRTLVVITADHGEGLNDHREPSHSYFVYESTMRVPLVFWGLPGLPNGKRIRAPVRTVDIGPTVLDLMGVPSMNDIDGVSLVPMIRGQQADLQLRGYGEATRFNTVFQATPLRFVREGDWKYIHKVNPELYDLGADPLELSNVVDAHPDVAARLRDALEAMLLAAPPKYDDAQAKIDEETAAMLIALGYVAKTPAPALEDEIASLELFGEDPTAKVDDLGHLAVTPSYMSLKNYEKALEELAPVRERNPNNQFVLGQVAEALVGLDRNEEALEVIEQLLSNDPSELKARKLLAKALRQKGESDRAIAVLTELAREDPCESGVQIDLNNLLYDLGRYSEQLMAVKAGAEDCPTLLPNLNNYAWVLATSPVDAIRDGRKAVEVIRGAIETLDRPDPAYLDTLAAALAESGRFEEAVEKQAEALRLLQSLDAPPPIVAKHKTRLQRYREGRPTRDPDTQAS